MQLLNIILNAAWYIQNNLEQSGSVSVSNSPNKKRFEILHSVVHGICWDTHS